MTEPEPTLTVTPRYDDASPAYRSLPTGVEIVRGARTRAATMARVGFAQATRRVYLVGALALWSLTTLVWLVSRGWALLTGALAGLWSLTWLVQEAFDRNTFEVAVPAAPVPEVRLRADTSRLERWEASATGGDGRWVEIVSLGTVRGVSGRAVDAHRFAVELDLGPAGVTALDDLTEAECARVVAELRELVARATDRGAR